MSESNPTPDLRPGEPHGVRQDGGMPDPPPLPAKGTKLSRHTWFFAQGGKRSEPLTTEQLRAAAKEAKVLPETLIWREGLANWVPARQVQGLFDPLLLNAQPLPKAEPPPIPLPQGLEYASPAKRALAFVIDLFVCLPVGIVLGAVLGDFGLLLYNAATVAYFTAMESSPKGATLGKIAMGLKVGKPDGTRLSIENALGRTLAKILSALPLGLGFLWCVFDDRSRCWHDFLAGTLVVCKSSPTGAQAQKVF